MEHLPDAAEKHRDALRPYTLNQLGDIAGDLPGGWRDDTITTETFALIANGIQRVRHAHGNIQTICVDYNSGHFPGIFVDTFLEKIQGAPVPHADLALTRGADDTTAKARLHAIEEFFNQGRLVPPILIVTDFIDSGTAIAPLSRFLMEHDLAFGVCTVGMRDTKNVRDTTYVPDDVLAELGPRLIVGSLGKNPGVTHFLHKTGAFLASERGTAFPRVVGTPSTDQQEAFAAMRTLGQRLADGADTRHT